MQDLHDHHPNPLCPKCAHELDEDGRNKEWLERNVHKCRQNGHGVYKHVAAVDSHTSTVSGRTSAATTCKQRSAIKMYILNPCSVCNKTSALQDFVTDHNIDLIVLTETWLKGDDRDNVILAELLPPGYTIKHKARQGCCGGVVIMHPSTLSVTRVEHSVSDSVSSPPQYASFEELQCLVHTVPAVRFVVILDSTCRLRCRMLDEAPISTSFVLTRHANA